MQVDLHHTHLMPLGYNSISFTVTVCIVIDVIVVIVVIIVIVINITIIAIVIINTTITIITIIVIIIIIITIVVTIVIVVIKCRRREGAAGLEDGTAHYLGIAAVRHGFHQLASLGGFPAIGPHTQAVTRSVYCRSMTSPV